MNITKNNKKDARAIRSDSSVKIKNHTLIPESLHCTVLHNKFQTEEPHMKGLTDYQKFLLLRPLPPKARIDAFGNPILTKDDFSDVDWNKVKYTSLSNMSAFVERKDAYIPLLFHFDYVLNRIWNDPLKYLAKFSGFLAVPTPDFSVYINMNTKEIEHNIFKSRWFGAWAQFMHYRVIPTCTWGGEETYDLCFSGLPTESIVLISTIGCLTQTRNFLKGFNEMKRRLKPKLIIVRGKRIAGMTGNFIFLDFEDTFNLHKQWEQIPLFELPKITTLKEVR